MITPELSGHQTSTIYVWQPQLQSALTKRSINTWDWCPIFMPKRIHFYLFFASHWKLLQTYLPLLHTTTTRATTAPGFMFLIGLASHMSAITSMMSLWIVHCFGHTTLLYCVTICPYSLFLGLIFSFLAITLPSHIISLLTTLVFIIASFHPSPWTVMTHSCLLVCTSLRFHCILPCCICFVIAPDFPESLVYKPSILYIFP